VSIVIPGLALRNIPEWQLPVMPGLDPGIHRLQEPPCFRWIAGSSPAMTKLNERVKHAT